MPFLLSDIQKIVDCNSQTDPSFKSQRLYTRLSARQVRKELISQFNYNEQELPSSETIRQKPPQLGYYPQRVAKTQPQKAVRPPKGFVLFLQVDKGPRPHVTRDLGLLHRVADRRKTKAQFCMYAHQDKIAETDDILVHI